jgi:thiamine biosynthesis lipoprotein
MPIKDYLKRLYPLLLILVVFIVWKVRNEKPESLVELSGTTMGPIGYSIKYYHPEALDFGGEVDSLLKVWNQSMSNYIPSSEVSRFNLDSCFTYESEYFLPVLRASRQVFDATSGAFDPTIGPLVDAWGFGKEETMAPDSATVDSLTALVGFDKIWFNDTQVCKQDRRMQVDFSAIAKGYAVDVVASFLQAKGIENLLVEIGGEIVCRGTKPGGELWRTAVEDPTVDFYEQRLMAVIKLTDRGVATSGNYRNFYVQDGRRYVHTISPVTGYPVEHTLLSATVVAPDCMTADAYATGFMVMGLDKAKAVLAAQEELEAFLLYMDDKNELQSYVTDGLADKIERINAED